MNRPAKVFISYAREDTAHCQALCKMLAVMRRQGSISIWHDRQIRPGQEWAGAIDQNLDAADLILLLVTANFLASDYIWDVEMKRALERHDAGAALVVPIFVSSCDWKGTPFAKLQGVPDPKLPIDMASNLAAAWTEVASAIREALFVLNP